MTSVKTGDLAGVEPIAPDCKGRCPRCGEGRLFSGFLTVGTRCANCGLDYSFADAGDGPAVFVILIIGFVVVGLALWMEVTLNPPLWLHFIIWIPLALVLCLTALRLIKGVLITLQYRNKAEQGRLDRPMTGMMPRARTSASRGCWSSWPRWPCGAARSRHLADASGCLEGGADRHDRPAHARRAAAARRDRTAVRRDGDVDYWPVEAQRHLPSRQASGISSRPMTGSPASIVYTPLRLQDGRVVFVNRGFVPYDRKDAGDAGRGQVAGAVTISGLARNPLADKPSSMRARQRAREEHLLLEGSRGDGGERPACRPVDGCCRSSSTRTPTPNPGGLPVGGVTIIDLPNNHLQYALTWYGLAAALRRRARPSGCGAACASSAASRGP